MPDAYTSTVMRRIVEYALEAGQAAQADPSGSITLGEGATRQTLYFTPGALCLRFVRQVYETALGIGPKKWSWATLRAKWTLEKLRAAGYQVPPRAPLMEGDIVGHRRGEYGHIGIVVQTDPRGVGTPVLVAENTSSTTRGNPRRAGTKLTQWRDFAAGGVEAYRLAEATEQLPPPVRIKVVQLGGDRDGQVIGEYMMHPDGDHIADQGKVYVYEEVGGNE